MRIASTGLLLVAIVAPFEVLAQEAPPPPDDWGAIPAPPLVEPAPLGDPGLPPPPDDFGALPPPPAEDGAVPPVAGDDFGLPPPAPDAFGAMPVPDSALPPPAPDEFGAPPALDAAALPPPPADFGAPPPVDFGAPPPADFGAPPAPPAAWPPVASATGADASLGATVGGPTPHSPGTLGLAFDDPRTTRLASSPGGPVGLAHVVAAEPGPAGTLRFGLHGKFFDTSGFPIRESDNQQVGGIWTLAWTPLPYLDLYGAYSLSSNRNDRGSPPLVQSLGDTWFGGKAGFLATDGLWLGADLRLAVYPAIGDQRPSALGFQPTGLLTWDVHSVAPSVPLRLHLNVGGRFDSTRKLADDTLTAAEAYALGVNEYNRLALAAGLEAPLPFVTPFVEFGTELPLGAPDALEQTDGQLVTPNAAAPRRLTLGGRVTAVSDLSILLAADIGLQRHVVEGIPATPPWELWFGLAYTIDPNPEERVRVIERVVGAPVAPAVAVVTGKVAGVVLDAATREPIPGAVVALASAGSPGLPPVATDAAAGRFLSHELPPGPVELAVTKEGFAAASATVVVEAGRETPAEVLLTREAARPASLLVRVRGPRGPIDAEVAVDGPQSARIALANGEGQAELPAGRYRIRASAKGFLSREATAEVSDGAPTTVQFELAPKPKTTGLVFSGKKILPKRTIRFRGESAEILPSSFPYLDEVAAAMIDNGYAKLRIDAHVSSAYGARAVPVTQERARAVKAYLVEKAGLDPDKLVLKAWGDSAPIAPNLTEPGRRMNTRVTFTILQR